MSFAFHAQLIYTVHAEAGSSSSEEEALSDVDESNISNKKVIVVGAGVAGIAAALFLKVHASHRSPDRRIRS